MGYIFSVSGLFPRRRLAFTLRLEAYGLEAAQIACSIGRAVREIQLTSTIDIKVIGYGHPHHYGNRL